jgi:hypothetical protein
MLLASAALACGSKAASGPSIRAYSATVGWTPTLQLQLDVEAPAADLSAIYYAWIRPDGSVIGREAMLLGAPLGDSLQGLRSVTATRVVGTGGFLAPTRLRLRAVDVTGKEGAAVATVLHPTFGAAGDACDGGGLACAGELACQGGHCATAATAEAACQAAAVPAWSNGVAQVPVPTGGTSPVAGTCWPLDAIGATISVVVLEAAAGEHLEVEVPLGAEAMLRSACDVPTSEVLCLTGGAGIDLQAGTYSLLVTGTAATSPGAAVRLTRTPL